LGRECLETLDKSGMRTEKNVNDLGFCGKVLYDEKNQPR
jgi:hypothetical protein